MATDTLFRISSIVIASGSAVAAVAAVAAEDADLEDLDGGGPGGGGGTSLSEIGTPAQSVL